VSHYQARKFGPRSTGNLRQEKFLFPLWLNVNPTTWAMSPGDEQQYSKAQSHRAQQRSQKTAKSAA